MRRKRERKEPTSKDLVGSALKKRLNGSDSLDDDDSAHSSLEGQVNARGSHYSWFGCIRFFKKQINK